jgi:hypothetical protein
MSSVFNDCIAIGLFIESLFKDILADKGGHVSAQNFTKLALLFML